MTIKNILQTVIIAGIISVVATLAIGSGKNDIQTPEGVITAINTMAKEVQKLKDKPLGALSGPDIPYNYFGVGGVRKYTAKKETLTTATTTPCSLQSPAATSTLASAAIRFEVGSTTKFVIDLAQATDQYSTTTKIGTTYEVAANTQATIVASTTDIATNLFSPNTWLVYKMGGGSGGNFSPTGVCQATWEGI